MEKIKKSFTKAFLPILIASFILMILERLEVLSCHGTWYLFDKLSGHSFINYSWSDYFILNGMSYLVQFIFAMVKSPLLCGVIGFCLARVNDEKANIGKIFYFYRSFKRIIISVIAVNTLNIFSDIQLYFLNLKAFKTSAYMPTPKIYTVGVVLSSLLYTVAMLFLFFWRYTYAENPESGLITTLKKSCRCALLAVPTSIITYILSVIFTRAVPDKYWDYLVFIYTALKSWIFFTVYYMAISGGIKLKVFEKTIQKINEKGVEAAPNAAYNIGGSYVYTQNTSVPNNEAEEETPFIEPYDFFIEADERFNDEKVIETEDIRGVDILAVLDEMNLIDDIKVNFVIRRKLKKMFEELSFEIGEYDTYNGGRSIENSFTEEIDEREFEIYVEISRNSDYEPFKLILRVDVLEEE